MSKVYEPEGYVVGNLRFDALQGSNRNWVVGQFMEGVHKTDQIEVKYWEFTKGEDTNHATKRSSTTEWTYILRGTIKAQLDEAEVILHEGEYVLIQPGVPNNTVAEILENAKGITVKSPSYPGAKQII